MRVHAPLTFEVLAEHLGLPEGPVVASDGGPVHQAVFPLLGANGVGLSPDRRRVYVAETYTGRLLAWELAAPGVLGPRAAGADPVHGGTCVAATPYVFDSLAVEAGGRIAVAATSSGIVVITPDGGQTDVYSLPGDAASNIAFADDGRRAVITLSRSGRLVQTCKYALAAMERAGRGAIVNIASVAGLRGSVIGGIEATGYRRPSTV